MQWLIYLCFDWFHPEKHRLRSVSHVSVTKQCISCSAWLFELTCRGVALSCQHTQSWGRVLRCPEKHRRQQLTLQGHTMSFYTTATRVRLHDKLLLPLQLLLLLPGRGGCCRSCMSALRDKLSLHSRGKSFESRTSTTSTERRGRTMGAAAVG